MPEPEPENEETFGSYAASFEDVMEAIASERVYQDLLWTPGTVRSTHSLTEWLSYIRDYTEEGLHILARQAKPACDMQVLDIVRKVAAMAVACMQENGAPHREIPESMTTAQVRHGIISREEKT